MLAHGNVAIELEQWQANEDQLMKSCKKTFHHCREWKSAVCYDAVGMGAMAGSKFNEINEDSQWQIAHTKFNAGGKIIDPEDDYSDDITNQDMFSNRKAQAWWSVADRLRNTWDAVTNGAEYEQEELISISSDIEDLEALITELSTPKKDYDKLNRVKVESKKDLEDREIRSPDLADAFIMAFAPHEDNRSLLDVLMAKRLGQ